MSMKTHQNTAVAGATGRAGRHVVDVLEAAGHNVVRISRADGVDVITGDGLAAALTGVDTIIDVATGPSPEEHAATEFFTTAARNLQEQGARAGVKLIVGASILGTDHFTAGYGAAKLAHERALLAGSVPARILRAAQFHEFVGQLVEWGTRGDVAYVPEMRTQLVAARTVAEVLVDLATRDDAPIVTDLGGPREESMVEAARRLVDGRIRIEGMTDPDDPDREVYSSGALLPGPDAILAGPTFEQWLVDTHAVV
jgi:uncharacterized protein YbjT (DUF2867 family)